MLLRNRCAFVCEPATAAATAAVAATAIAAVATQMCVEARHSLFARDTDTARETIGVCVCFFYFLASRERLL